MYNVASFTKRIQFCEISTEASDSDDGQQVVFLFVRKSVDDPNMIGILSTAHAWSLETRKQCDNNKVKLNF